MTRRRGTAIIETSKGILVVAGRHGSFLLPGGGSDEGESRHNSAIRELKEETGLDAYYIKYLFTHHAPHIGLSGRRIKHRDLHKVYLIKAKGDTKPNFHDVHRIEFWKPGSDILLSGTTKLIINRYLTQYKQIADEEDMDLALFKKYKFNKCQNLLLGIAVGDAFGAAFEGKYRKKVAKKFQLEYYRPGGRGWKKGKYTDDTQMSIAVSELILSQKEFSKYNLAEQFLYVYRRNPHNGYGSSVKEGLRKSKDTNDFLKIIPGNSSGNGACMRSSIIGILPKIKDVIYNAKINAEVTHNTPSAIASSVCVAAASHYFYYELGEPKKVFDYCINACKGLDEKSVDYFKKVKEMKELDPILLFGEDKKDFGVPVNGMRTAGAVLYLISLYYDNPVETLKQSILLGGDTDSTASIALGIVSIRTGIGTLPFFLFRDLENSGYGRDYLIDLGTKLFTLYPN